MHVVIFEGNRWKEFAPLTLSRPIFALATGASSLLAKQLRHLAPTRLTLWVRPQLVDYTRRYIVPHIKCPTAINVPIDDEPALIVSARKLMFREKLSLKENTVMVDDGEHGEVVRTAYVRSPGLSPEDALKRTPKWLKLLDMERIQQQGRLAEHLWDLLDWNEESLVEDSIGLERNPVIPAGPYHVIQEQTIFLGRGVDIQPGVVLDGSRGPVIIGDGAYIGANSVIQGPVAIGAHSIIRPLAHIRPGTTIGPACKIGGEIANSIIQGNSNKAHFGFLGDSYIGEWVNFGAGTSTSNLKNTYGMVSVQIGSRTLETGRRFVGAVIGDHTKTSVDTRINTGTYIGYSCMIAPTGPTPKFVPSFTFLTDEGAKPYRTDKAVEVMQQMRARRQQGWDEVEEKLLGSVRELAGEVEK